MPDLFAEIRAAVDAGNFVVSWHADERCEERCVMTWQLVISILDGKVIAERPRSRPNPSVVVRQVLPDGREADVVWAWLAKSRRAKLVTVYFRD